MLRNRGKGEASAFCATEEHHSCKIVHEGRVKRRMAEISDLCPRDWNKQSTEW